MEQKDFSSRKLALGLILLAFGALTFLDSVDLWSPRMLWRLWPLGLIVLGLASEIDAFRARRGGSGSILIGIGLWMLAGTHHILGLTHRTGFPLAIVVVGLFMTLHAVLDRPVQEKKENNHELC
jgi:Domain of unknown function (DUF5668)